MKDNKIRPKSRKCHEARDKIKTFSYDFTHGLYHDI